MNSLEDNIVKSVLSKILDGDDPRQISRDLKVGLEKVLLVGFGLHKSKPKHDKPFNVKYSSFIRACLEYGVPSRDIASALEISIEPSSEFELNDSNANHLSNNLNGAIQTFERPYQDDEDTTFLKRRANSFSSEANKITAYGAICANHKELEFLFRLWKSADYSKILSISGVEIKSKSQRAEASSILYRSAGRVIQDIDTYADGLKSNQELHKYFKGALEEMKDSADDILSWVYSSIPKR